MWFISDCHVVNISCIEKKKINFVYCNTYVTTLCLSPYLAYYEKLTWASIKKNLEIKEKPRENLVECLSDTIRGIT